MNKIITTVEATDLLSQLGRELVVSYTAENITVDAIVTALLNFQVLTPAITKGTISGSYSGLTRSIKVDGDTILRALFRLRDTVGGYIYVDNDRKLQWASSLGEDKGQQIRYRKNLKGIERDIDYSSLINKLYCYGEGEGTARIKLSDASGQTEDYVEDVTSQGAPPNGWGGIYVGVMVDRSITHPDTLLAWANLKLADVKNPVITYRVDTVDLSESTETDFSFESLQLGSTIKVIDEDLEIDVSVAVVKIEHPDLLHPEQMTLELSTRVKDITDTLLEVYDRQQFDQHIATEIGAGQVIVKGAFTVKDWVTDGETTIVGSNIETGTISLGRLDFIPLSSSGTTGEIIATINASTEEGLTINADKISINVGKSIFKQDAIPTSVHVGDLWFDTNDDNKLYRAACVGADQIVVGEWELVRDTLITTNQSNITQNANNISTNVSSITTVNGRVDTCESNITQNVTDINLRVEKNDVIHQINISTEGILIDGDNTHITGTTTIDNGVIKNAHIESLAASKITAGTITVGITTGVDGTIRSGSGSSRIELTSTGIKGYCEGTPRMLLSSNGSGWLGSSNKIRWHTDGTVEVYDAAINSLTVSKLTAGNLSVTGTLTGSGIVKSSNYLAGSAGWQIEADGSAEFNNVKVRGSIYTSSIISGNTLTVSGTISAGGGNVTINDSDGITINEPVGEYGPYLIMKNAGTTVGYLCTGDSQMVVESCGSLLLMGSDVTLDSDYDIILTPTGHDVRPHTANDTDLGTSTYYFRTLEIVDINYHSPMKMAKNALDKIRAVRTEIINGVESIDKTSLPEQVLRRPTPADDEKANLTYLRDIKSYNAKFERLRWKHPERANSLMRPIRAYPTVAVNSNDLLGLIISSIQELANKIDKREGS